MYVKSSLQCNTQVDLYCCVSDHKNQTRIHAKESAIIYNLSGSRRRTRAVWYVHPSSK
uniref:Uncharacterized protein n=1 Tax=Arundo donax TaxID=35708 RepID=A0A0A9EB25_ARUDO